MAFTVRDFRDFVTLLEQHPEWRGELRRLVLTDELLDLPQMVRELVEAQQRTEQRVTELAEAQQRTEQWMERLETTMQALAEAQLRTERRVGRLEGEVGSLKGMVLESRYRERGFAYFARLMRRTHVLSGDELLVLLEDAVTQGRLSEEGADEVARADVVARGLRRDDGVEMYLVAEVSWGVGTGDVERAVRRASLLAQTGVHTIAVVAGEQIVDEAVDLARAMHVWQVLDGQVVPPPSP